MGCDLAIDEVNTVFRETFETEVRQTDAIFERTVIENDFHFCVGAGVMARAVELSLTEMLNKENVIGSKLDVDELENAKQNWNAKHNVRESANDVVVDHTAIANE